MYFKIFKKILLVVSLVFLLSFDFKKCNLNKIKVIKNEKYFSSEGNPNYSTDSCLNWNYLSDEEIKRVILNSDSITSEEENYFYEFYPCGNKGLVIIMKDTFNFIINAGGTIYLHNNQKEIRLGCKDSSCKKFFIPSIEYYNSDGD